MIKTIHPRVGSASAPVTPEDRPRPGVFRYSVKSLRACYAKVNTDNVQAFNRMVAAGDGVLFTLDARPYIALCDEFALYFLFTPMRTQPAAIQ